MYSGTMETQRNILKWVVEIATARIPLCTIDQMQREYYALADYNPLISIQEILYDKILRADEALSIRIVPVKRPDILIASTILKIDHTAFVDFTTKP